ncbi:MupA/Atu3671 family FMN-dependent luciferase-like monooxygenase [Aquimarina muelleri]|uniref:MupA/Atu3671 family FMN-dependent luciferase-like monooxygenase n=1 Tax=Aquimarina muelleri TaxID=279356 RepID=UPI003F689327
MKKQLIHKLISYNVNLKVVDGKLKINAPKGVLTKDLLEEIKSNKEYLINLLSSQTKIPKTQTSDSYPVTPSQVRFWVLSKFEGGNEAYSISNELEFEGVFEKEIFLSAFHAIIKRHESLRTYFKENENGELRQYVVPFEDVDFTINYKDASSLEPAEREEIISKHQSCSFDLEKAPLLKIEAIKIEEKKHLLLFNLHHIVGDGWSLEILSREVIQVYNALLNKQKIELEELPIQYKDYTVWLESEEQQKRLETSREYWLDKLQGELPVLELPEVKKRPKIKTYTGDSFEYYFSEKFTETLGKFSKKADASIFMALTAGINGVFYRYTNKTDLVLGTAVAGREHPDLAGQIGLYLNTLPIRTQFDMSASFKDLLSIQKTTLIDLYKYQNYPFNELVEQLDIKRDTSRSALFDVLVLMQNQQDTLASNEFSLEDIKVQPYENKNKKTSQFDITFSFTEQEKQIKVAVEYNTDIYNEDFISRLLTHLECFIAEGIKNPTQSIATIEYLSAKEKEELILDFNNTSVDYSKDVTVLDSFNTQVQKTPKATALIFEEKELSYADLDKKSDQLANYLISKGVDKDKVVGLCVDRSHEMIIGILGILKTGAAYLPLDPSYPIDRLDYVIEDSEAALIVTKEAIKNFIPNTKNIVCFEEETIWDTEDFTLSKVDSSLSAYMIYTSGTTGKPKGVRISHQNLYNFFLGLNNQFEISEKVEVWLAVTSMSFDISILEMIWTLTRGSKVVIQSDRPVVVNPLKQMDFSLFYFAAQEEVKTENKYNLLLKGADYADKNEFKSIWVPERHFHSFGDQFPNPSIAAAAVAATTKNITIRSGSVVLPLHDPVRVAEEWSMVDNLSNGRVELSIASGWHPNDFVLAPQDYENRHQIMKDKITTLKNIWKGDSLIRKNGIGQDFEFQIHPKPVQKDLKIWITAARSIETFKYAGTIGANILTHLLGQNIEDLKDKITVYRETLQENGFDPDAGKVAVMLHTFVSNDTSYVKEVVEEPFKNYLKHSINLMRTVASDANLDIDKDLDMILEMGFQRFYKTSGLFGTPESCLSRIKELNDVGVNEIACLLDFGIETDTVITNLEYLKRLNVLVDRNKAQYDFLSNRLQNQKPIAKLIKENKVTNFQTTPSFVQELLIDEEGKEALQQIETLLVGGEALSKTISNTLLDIRKKSIFNMYGPTETTIWSTIKEITEKDTITIGKPIANTQVYILDENRQLCPVGVTGELCIAGDGVSVGYKDRESLTAEKFIENPFNSAGESKYIYRTGDVARWLPNGELECLGRIDNQIKLRGHRIELGEIEHTLKIKENVVDAAVGITTDASGEKELTAYIISEDHESTNILRGYLLEYLPKYMIPNRYIYVKEFPLTPNGKLDRKALIEINGEYVVKREYVAPGNEIETKLTSIWEEVLGVNKIGVTDDFFELGGHSLKAISMRSKVNKEFNLNIEFTLIFKSRNILELAKFIEYTLWDKQELEVNLVVDKVMI